MKYISRKLKIFSHSSKFSSLYFLNDLALMHQENKAFSKEHHNFSIYVSFDAKLYVSFKEHVKEEKW